MTTPLPQACQKMLNATAKKLIIFLSGLCVLLCFMPFAWGFLAFLILVPFLLFSGLMTQGRHVMANSYIFGLGYFLGSLYWIAELEPQSIAIPALRIPATAVLCLYLALFMLLTGLFTKRLSRAGIPSPIAFSLSWMAVEYLRSLGPLGFPWASLGYSQTPYLAVVQQASVVGVYGISGWIALINGILASLILSRRKFYLWLLILTFCIPLGLGFVSLRDDHPNTTLRCALVQPNISGAVKWDESFRDSTMEILIGMTYEVRGADLIIWPETAVPFHIKHSPTWLDSLTNLAREVDAALLIGFPDYERGNGSYHFFNSAMLVTRQGAIEGEYRKIHLVPFGEMIPFEDRIGFLSRIDLGQGNFSPGLSYTVFDLHGVNFSVAICFESIYPDLIRKFVDRGARVIVNITNDEWFGPSPGPYQHAQMSIMRAVEFGVGIARCANTGISMFVDPQGRVTGRSDLFQKTILKGDVAVGTGQTPYRRIGHHLELCVLLGVVALSIFSLIWIR